MKKMKRIMARKKGKKSELQQKQAFRAFRAENVVRICAVSIPNYMENKK